MYYSYVRSIVIDGDLNFRNEWRDLKLLPDVLKEDRLFVKKTGYLSNKYPIGFSILSLPWFLLAHFLTKITNLFGFQSLSPDGYSLLYDLLVPFGHLVYAIIGFYFGVLFLAKYFDRNLSMISLSTIWFSTNLLYYSSVFQIMSHAGGFFCLSMSLYFALQCVENLTYRNSILLGIFIALGVLMRPTNLILFIPIVYLFSSNFSTLVRKSNAFKIAVSKILTFSILFLQILTWKILYGSYLKYSYGNEGFNWSSPEVLNVLFSSNHGWIYWAPVVVPSVIGLFVYLFKEKDKGFSLSIISSILLMVYVNASWHEWFFGHSYGARCFVEVSLFLAFGYASFSRFLLKRALFIYLLSNIFVLYNTFLLYLYVTGQIPPVGEIDLFHLIFS